LNKNPELRYRNINPVENVHLHTNSKINQLMSPSEAFALLPMSHGDGRSTVDSLISPSHQSLKSNSHQNYKIKHERKRRRSQKYRGIFSIINKFAPLKKYVVK